MDQSSHFFLTHLQRQGSACTQNKQRADCEKVFAESDEMCCLWFTVLLLMVAATLAAQSYYISKLFKHFKFYLKFRQINASVFNESLFNLVSCGFRLLHLRLVCQDSLCISYAHRLTIILCLFFSFPLFLSLSPSCSYFLFCCGLTFLLILFHIFLSPA